MDTDSDTSVHYDHPISYKVYIAAYLFLLTKANTYHCPPSNIMNTYHLIHEELKQVLSTDGSLPSLY